MSEPISRDQVLATLKKHVIATIDGVTEEALAGAKSLGDIGANSLDVVEIVSSTMRELRIKVPRSELMLVESFDELVDLLHQHSSNQAPPAAAE